MSKPEDEPIDFDRTTTVIHEGDFNERAIGITFETALAILSLGKNAGDVLALYCFYCITARRQRHGNVIHATTSYSARGLGWSNHRVSQARSKLEAQGLAELITHREGGRIIAHRVKVNFLLSVHHNAFSHRVEKLPSENPTAIADKGKELKNSKAKRSEWEASVDFIDDDLQTEWAAYQMMYRQKWGAMTVIARGRKVTKLSKWDNEKALASLREAISHEWKDVYPPKEQAKPKLPYRKREDRINFLNRKKQELVRSNAPYWKIHEIDMQLNKL